MLIIILGMFSGLLLGITGGGGAIVSVPALVYGLHIPMQVATTISLFVVGASALLGAFLKRKNVEWGKGFIFATVGGLMTPVGVYFSHQISERLLILGFAILMLVVAYLMFRKSLLKDKVVNNNLQKLSTIRSFWQILPIAVLTGVLTGFFGVGGGFMIVPALVILNGMENKTAAATSLLIITLISFSSLLNKINTIEMDFNLVSIFMIGSIIGMVSGSFISQKISNRISQRIFAAVALILGCYMVFDSVMNWVI